MASGRMRFYAQSRGGQTNFSFVMPSDVPPMMIQGNKYYERETKNLYLLHGYSGNDEDWERNGIAEDLSLNYNLNVFMIDGGNNFYLDRKSTGCQFQTFAGKEIIDYTRKVFGLSDKREDTIIGGLSMGGFGAMHTALAYPDTFGGAVCLSSALIVHQITGMKPGTATEAANYEYYHEVFGDLEHLDETDANPEVLYAKLKKEGKQIPAVYMAVGTEDFVYELNQETRKFLEGEGALLKYEEGPGVHDWKFWNHYAPRGVEWVLEQIGG